MGYLEQLAAAEGQLTALETYVDAQHAAVERLYEQVYDEVDDPNLVMASYDPAFIASLVHTVDTQLDQLATQESAMDNQPYQTAQETVAQHVDTDVDDLERRLFAVESTIDSLEQYLAPGQPTVDDARRQQDDHYRVMRIIDDAEEALQELEGVVDTYLHALDEYFASERSAAAVENEIDLRERNRSAAAVNAKRDRAQGLVSRRQERYQTETSRKQNSDAMVSPRTQRAGPQRRGKDADLSVPTADELQEEQQALNALLEYDRKVQQKNNNELQEKLSTFRAEQRTPPATTPRNRSHVRA